LTDVIEFRLTGVNDEMCVVSVLNDLVDDCDRSWVASVNDVRGRRGDQPQIVSSLHLYEGNKVLHSVCPSVPVPMAHSGSECRSNFKFIGDIL